VLVLLDTETTGVDISRDRVVELAALHCPSDARFFGGAFSTVVRVDPTLLAERGAAASAVHGIEDHEIAVGPDFPTAWRRFLLWTESLLNSAVADRSDSEDDEPLPPQLSTETPVLMLAGHNAIRFDFPLLLCECMRHHISCDCFEHWLFVDTMPAAQSARSGCM